MKIGKAIPPKFGLVFDGWSVVDVHFLGVFATFRQSGKRALGRFLLAFYPLEDKPRLNADEHTEFIHFVTSVFGKSVENGVVNIGADDVTNKSIATKVGIPQVGYHNHILNVSV